MNDREPDSGAAGPTSAAPEASGEFNREALAPSDINTALVHFYRGEVARSNTWRTRLDATTNWAVVTTAAGLTFAFGAVDHTPVVIQVVTLLVLLFLFIEARRYRYYELWTHRVRVLETNYIGGLLSPPMRPLSGWGEHLTETLRNPTFPIGLLEALGRRYRRNYALVFLILAVSWLAKVAIHPEPVRQWGEFVERAAVGPVPGWVVLVAGTVFNGALVALGLFTVGLRQTDAEVLGKAPRGLLRILARFRAATREALEVDLTGIKPTTWGNGRKQLVYIISDEIEALSQPLLEELGRGVTLIRGVGMYSGKEHGILMCVVRGRQVGQVKEIIAEHDPQAFVVITSAQDVRGSGFRPIEA